MDEHFSTIDLFAGAGGLSRGLEQAGFFVTFANEINPNCADTYLQNRKLSNDSVFVGDIAILNQNIKDYSSRFKDTYLVCGGPPCQGFSMANRQRIIDDPRNSLYLEYLKFLKAVHPKVFIMENVRGMLQRKDEILENFEKFLGKEYDVAVKVLNAKNFSVPQNRERIIFIGNRLGKSSSQIFTTLDSFPQTSYTLFNAIGDLPELKPNRHKNNSSLENEDIGFFERDFKYDNTAYSSFINNKRSITKLFNHKNRYNNDRDIEIFTRLPQGANSLHESIQDIMPYTTRNDIFKDKYFKLKYDEVCKTITSHMKFDCNMYIHPTQSRGLSPREAARIQSFPDDYVFYGPQNSWYLQIGNAVPVKMAEQIGRAIMTCFN